MKNKSKQNHPPLTRKSKSKIPLIIVLSVRTVSVMLLIMNHRVWIDPSNNYSKMKEFCLCMCENTVPSQKIGLPDPKQSLRGSSRYSWI